MGKPEDSGEDTHLIIRPERYYQDIYYGRRYITAWRRDPSLNSYGVKIEMPWIIY